MASQTTNQITSTLQSLLPSYNTNSGTAAFPPALINLTHSLLQRSRARVPSLKAEEEVARCWVVAEIACHRLKTRLNLPKIESRPPCPPRLYKKVYAYLEGSLADEASTGRTPRKEGGGLGTDGDARRGNGLERRLPERLVAVQAPKQSGGVGESNRVTRNVQTASGDRGLKRPRVSSVMDDKSGEVEEGSDSSDGSSEESDEEQFVDAGEYIDEDEENSADGEEEHETSAKKSSSFGRGSVMESRYDWLSDERRKDFTQWKAGIMRQIDEMERAGKRPRTEKQKAIK